MEKRHRENALEREELDRSLDEQRERLDSIGTLLEHAMTFINEHPTPETSPWKKKEKPSTPERRTPSPTSEPVSPITVIKVPQASGFARKASLRRPLFPKPSNNNTTQQPNLPRPKQELPPKPTHLTTMTPIFSSTPVETKIRQAPKVTDL
ncbi:Oidioi.mRNA.OKI2018_I69.PAR.g10917.t1.cds [Oikopleura dioica]|uniref:Oidioi.mRNA.OKI2018_I69.PAR.g10917.t1.cds n=1 Tax=Oikopleura dioica TaxID=34765 RepID=A0ABN7RWM7_OIKDI|nr:Oidioi.mRNA.OKI2018_I69.PAR.g10917.t1.cds [Oikopleura dioica]